MMAASSTPPLFDDRAEAVGLNMSFFILSGERGSWDDVSVIVVLPKGPRNSPRSSVLHLQACYNTLDFDLGMVSKSASVSFTARSVIK